MTIDRLLEVVDRALRHVRLLRERDHARETETQVLKNLASLRESASILTHEIRMPVTSLRHALAAVGGKLGVECRVLVEELVKSLDKIKRLLGQTLWLAKSLALQCASFAVGRRRSVRCTSLWRIPARTCNGTPAGSVSDLLRRGPNQ